jgi:hypothetical protein
MQTIPVEMFTPANAAVKLNTPALETPLDQAKLHTINQKQVSSPVGDQQQQRGQARRRNHASEEPRQRMAPPNQVQVKPPIMNSTVGQGQNKNGFKKGLVNVAK